MKKQITFETDEHREISPGLVLAVLIIALFAGFAGVLIVYFLIYFIGWVIPVLIAVGAVIWGLWLVFKDEL